MARLTFAQALILLLSASMLAVCMASGRYPDWYRRRSPPCPQNNTNTSNKIIVGGSQNWTFGVDYTGWAIKHGPFFLNDTLVFKYDLPVDNNSHPHNVYLLPDYWSFLNCDLNRGVQIANETQGGGDGFQFVLKRWQPYFFACGGGAGFHCTNGSMKFFVMPTFRRWY